LQNTFNDDALETKIESARFALEDHIRRKLYGSGSYIQVPNITGEELEEDRQSQEEPEDEDGEDADDMDIPPKNGITEDQHGTDDMDEDQESNVADDAVDDAMFDEDGDFQDDLESLDGDMHVEPNALSEKVAAFVECFSVTGDVARQYLDRNGEDLELACQNFMDVSNVREAGTSRRRHVCDGPVIPSEHGKSSYPGGGAGGPSNPGDVDLQNKGKGKKRTADDDDNPCKNVKPDDDNDDDNDDDHPNGLLSNNRFHALHASQTSMQQEADIAYLQAFASQMTQSELQRRRRRLREQARKFRLEAWEAQAHHALPSTSSVFESDRGRSTERSFFGRVIDTAATSDNERAPARPSRTTVRRDSSLGLAANYSEDGQQVSEYRPYESPRTTTTRQQMVEQRMRHLASDGNTAQDSIEHRSNSNEHSPPSRQPGQHGGLTVPSSASNAFGALQSQSQQNSPYNEYRTL
jgi:hypothetical protein